MERTSTVLLGTNGTQPFRDDQSSGCVDSYAN